jgi:hypothetical protein
MDLQDPELLQRYNLEQEKLRQAKLIAEEKRKKELEEVIAK